MKTAQKGKSEDSLDILELQVGRLLVCILGTTPVFMNRMSEKVQHELLFPAAKKNAAARASSLKHSPMDEFRASPYTSEDPTCPTLITFPSSGFKGAMKTAALDLPGSSKAQIGRLVWVEGERVPIYGIPKLAMSVVRCKDINRTPDVRTRAVIPEWACFLAVRYASPILKERAVANLLAASGQIAGIGDWRPEKGSGSYGQFRLVDEDDADFQRIISTGVRDTQVEAMTEPEYFDRETAELMEWYTGEVSRRGFKPTPVAAVA